MIHSATATRADGTGVRAETTAGLPRDTTTPLPDRPDDVPALWCQATLLGTGRPGALVRETGYRAAFTGRRPPDPSPHPTPAPPSLVS